MPIYLYSIDSTFYDGHGVVLDKGMRLSSMSGRADLDTFKDGAALELRLPDDSILHTNLFISGIAVTTNSDGSQSGEDDPYYRLTLPKSLLGTDLPKSLLGTDLPKGTEIWWRIEVPGLSQEQVVAMQQAEFEPAASSSSTSSGAATGAADGSTSQPV